MKTGSIPVTIYHNPACGTSRNALALIRNAGIEPTVVEYLKNPPDLATLVQWSADQLIDQMLAHPILMNRPIVVSPWGVRLCRPSQAVLEILPLPQRGAFTKEDGERVLDDRGQRIG